MTRSHYLRASDLRIGWVFISKPPAVVCVLPKPWRSPPAKGVQRLMPAGTILGDDRQFWSCFQGDVIEVADHGDAKAILLQLHDYTARRITKAERAKHEKAKNEQGLGELGHWDDDGEGQLDDQALRAKRLFTLAAMPHDEDSNCGLAGSGAMAALIRLLEDTKRLTTEFDHPAPWRAPRAGQGEPGKRIDEQSFWGYKGFTTTLKPQKDRHAKLEPEDRREQEGVAEDAQRVAHGRRA